MTLSSLHPVTVFIYFVCTAGITMFTMNPVLLGMSFLGSVMFFFLQTKKHGVKAHIYFLILFLLMVLINPLFNHNGKTVLFVINNNPVTLEAVVFGALSGVMVISVIYWFRSFSEIMTADKLICLFGRISPKFALLFSMTLRNIPLFSSQAKKIKNAGKITGLRGDDTLTDSIRSRTADFSALTSWALESGIDTADSMSARGAGSGRRTAFSVFRFRNRDFAVTCVILVLTGIIIAAMIAGDVSYSCYPELSKLQMSLWGTASCVSFSVLCLLPSVLEITKCCRKAPCFSNGDIRQLLS